MINMPSAMNAFKMIDDAFGTQLGDLAVKYGLAFNPEKEITRKEEMSLCIQYPDVAEAAFSMQNYTSDMERLSDAFGFDKSRVKLIGTDDNETFLLGLNLIDMILSGLSLLPLDKSDKIRKGVHLVATTIKKFIPSMKDMGRLLAQAPALNKYAKAFGTFGECLDKALVLLNDGSDPSKAIDAIKEGIYTIRHIDVEDIMKEAKANQTKPVALKGEVVSDPPKNDKNKKQKEVKNVSQPNANKSDPEQVAEAVAMTQSAYVPQWMGQSPQTAPNLDVPQYGTPDFANPELLPEPSNKTVPDFIAQNSMTVPRANPMAGVFSPVEQEPSTNQIWSNFPFVGEIISIANRNGYMIQAEPIMHYGRLVGILFKTYNDSGFLPNKTFSVDLGTVIDKRYGIWPSGVNENNLIPFEYCNIAYYLTDGEQNLNADLIDKIIKFGFGGLDQKTLGRYVLYREPLIKTNQRIELLQMQTCYMSHDDRSIIRGACIRVASKLPREYGRFGFESLDPANLEFVLNNSGVPDYTGGPVSARKPMRILMTPKRDKDGKYILVRPDKGTDILYDYKELM